jgi:hypothetical protein
MGQETDMAFPKLTWYFPAGTEESHGTFSVREANEGVALTEGSSDSRDL